METNLLFVQVFVITKGFKTATELNFALTEWYIDGDSLGSPKVN